MAPVEFKSDWVDFPEVWFDQLWEGLSWIRHHDAPRREYWATTAGKPYTYGRGQGQRTYQPQPSHAVIDLARAQLFGRTGVMYEGCFLNGYEDQRDSLGWHSDDDPNIDHTKPIAVITLGQEREIQFKPIGSKGADVIERQMLTNGSLLLMLPGMQQTHLHRIPKAGFVAKPRISLTFRGLINSPTPLNDVQRPPELTG